MTLEECSEELNDDITLIYNNLHAQDYEEASFRLGKLMGMFEYMSEQYKKSRAFLEDVKKFKRYHTLKDHPTSLKSTHYTEG